MNDKSLRIIILILSFIIYFFLFYGCGASGYGKFEFENEYWASHTCSGRIIYSVLETIFGRDPFFQTSVRYIYWPLNFYFLWLIWTRRAEISNYVKKIYNKI